MRILNASFINQTNKHLKNMLAYKILFFNIENNDYLLKTKYKINNKTGIKIFSENIIYLLIFNKLTNLCFF